VFGLERRSFQFDDDIAAQLQMVEKQIDEKFVATHLQSELASDERKAGAKFHEEAPDVLRQCTLDVALLGVFCQTEKIEYVRILQGIASEV
jgi:hypothetical protein